MNNGRSEEVEYSCADEMHELSHCLLPMKGENRQLGDTSSSSRESFCWRPSKKKWLQNYWCVFTVGYQASTMAKRDEMEDR